MDPKNNEVESEIPTMYQTEAIVRIINSEWTCQRNTLTKIKEWMDSRLQDELNLYYPFGLEYTKAVFDIDSIRQVTMIVNIMVEYLGKINIDEWGTIEECVKLTELITPEYIDQLELITSAVAQVAELNMQENAHDDEFRKTLEDGIKILSDMSETCSHLVDDEVFAALVSRYVCAYLKVVIKHSAIMMHCGAKRVRHDIFNQAIRMTLIHSNVHQQHLRSYNLAYTALYESLAATKYVATKKVSTAKK